MSTDSDTSKSRPSNLRLGIVITMLAALTVLVLSFDLRAIIQDTLNWIDGLGYWAPVLFIIIYAISCVLLVPASFLTLAAGVMFGVVKGSIIVSIAATLGATCAFLVGRYFAHDWVRKRFEGSARFEAIDHAVTEEGWKIVGLSRLAPVFPFFLLNYLYSLTRIPLRHYILASWIGMIPGTTLFVYIGSLAGSLTALGSGEARERSNLEWAFYGVGLIATLLITVYVTKIAWKALNRKMDLEEDVEEPSSLTS